MNIYVMRHGIAAELAASSKDSDRPLTSEGKRKVREIAICMDEFGVRPEVIISSPYTRARQTAEIVAQTYKTRPRLELADALTPSGSMKKLVELIQHLPKPKDNVLLVGHEPYLSEFISLLISGETGAGIQLKKAGLSKIAAEQLQDSRCGVLEWLLTPKQLRKLG